MGELFLSTYYKYRPLQSIIPSLISISIKMVWFCAPFHFPSFVFVVFVWGENFLFGSWRCRYSWSSNTCDIGTIRTCSYFATAVMRAKGAVAEHSVRNYLGEAHEKKTIGIRRFLSADYSSFLDFDWRRSLNISAVYENRNGVKRNLESSASFLLIGMKI